MHGKVLQTRDHQCDAIRSKATPPKLHLQAGFKQEQTAAPPSCSGVCMSVGTVVRGKLQMGQLLLPKLAFKQIGILLGNMGLSSLELNNLQIVSPSHEQEQHFK